MRRFIITGRFVGKVEVHYNSDGLLRKIDFAAATLTPDAIKWFKVCSAVQVENINEGFGNHVTVQETEFEVTFEDFMREYPYKRNTHLARIYWPKLTSPQQYQAFIAAGEYRKFLERNTWQKPKIADKWLKEQQYLNDWKVL